MGKVSLEDISNSNNKEEQNAIFRLPNLELAGASNVLALQKKDLRQTEL